MLQNLIIALILASCIAACENVVEKPDSTEMISDATAQDTIFKNLVYLTNKTISSNQLDDSLAFLVLPVKLSCPACRKKTIDSLVKHQDNLPGDHFVIISASEGLKNIRSYFLEVDKEIPVMENQLFLDSTHAAQKKHLVKDNPVIYYTARQKAYRKVTAIPATVKDDLREFFSGSRAIGQISKKD